MATDNQEPRTKLIVGLALLCIGTFLGIRAGLQTYFASNLEEEQQRKLLTVTRIVRETRELQEGRLANPGGTGVSIADAIRRLSAGEPTPEIAPQPSPDSGPIQGWTGLAPAAPAPAANTNPLSGL